MQSFTIFNSSLAIRKTSPNLCDGGFTVVKRQLKFAKRSLGVLSHS